MLRATKILLVYLLFLEQLATVASRAALGFSFYKHCLKRLAGDNQLKVLAVLIAASVFHSFNKPLGQVFRKE